MQNSDSTAWLRDWSMDDQVELRVLCLPPAGGSSRLYRRWPHLLPPHVGVVSVELPGRGTRADEPAATTLEQIVPPLSRAAAGLLDRPLVVFGHSMGGAVGAELVRELRRSAGLVPDLLVAAGCEPPRSPRRKDDVDRLTDAGLRDFLAQAGGTPQELLANEEYLRMLMPVLRADLTVLAGRPVAPQAPPLDCPVRVYLGADDRSVSQERAARWQDESDGDFQIRIFPGGHFFVQESTDLVLARLGQDVAQVLRRARAATG
ncbi:Surfactin synthase thioesterase subunit [Actinacidiphila yanglinensis]|uniref:Surfactin synthase thioesterase subunit n=1 Tax=Actinacidiphila yanglinensis TaxID=310779 RepID=A0A1H6DHR8_9ACTN|nr:alpha/beta fold hydrolase [Actinacidiphila yanglinensis]SEG84363.1 Surfactin synthase thioesterase subunit [Actinacidiphila yanglinensis]